MSPSPKRTATGKETHLTRMGSARYPDNRSDRTRELFRSLCSGLRTLNPPLFSAALDASLCARTPTCAPERQRVRQDAKRSSDVDSPTQKTGPLSRCDRDSAPATQRKAKRFGVRDDLHDRERATTMRLDRTSGRAQHALHSSGNHGHAHRWPGCLAAVEEAGSRQRLTKPAPVSPPSCCPQDRADAHRGRRRQENSPAE